MCGWYYVQRKTASKALARRQKFAGVGGLRVLPVAPDPPNHSNCEDPTWRHFTVAPFLVLRLHAAPARL